jgi:predicted TIM-barrel fold metal-dependent hydrolase
MDAAYDIHFHALTLAQPSFLSFLQALRSRRIEALYSQVFAPDFLLSAIFKDKGGGIRYFLSVAEHEVGGILGLVEDDLRGRFSPGEEPLAAEEGSLDLGGQSSEALVLCPLLIDFSPPKEATTGCYYAECAPKPIEKQVDEVLEGIKAYRIARPRGMLVVRPFLGINPATKDETEVKALLKRYFGNFVASRSAAFEAFRRAEEYSGDPFAPPALPFSGIKLYPPLGFDPGESSAAGKAKLDYLFSFCEERRIPLVVHCNDQGYWTVPLEKAWEYTDPAKWIPVLLDHPDLVVDFAHFGRRYVKPVAGGPQTDWREGIIALCADFPNVYADVAFNGSDPGYYDELLTLLESLPRAQAKLLEGRLLFGSDFPLILSRVRSYSDYLRTFGDSPLPRALKKRMVRENPEKFLFE